MRKVNLKLCLDTFCWVTSQNGQKSKRRRSFMRWKWVKQRPWQQGEKLRLGVFLALGLFQEELQSMRMMTRTEHLNGLGNGNWSVNDDRYHYCGRMEKHLRILVLEGFGQLALGSQSFSFKSVYLLSMTKMRNLVGNCHLIGNLLLVIRGMRVDVRAADSSHMPNAERARVQWSRGKLDT